MGTSCTVHVECSIFFFPWMNLRQQAVPTVLCYYYMRMQVSSPRVFISPPSCSAIDLLLLKAVRVPSL